MTAAAPWLAILGIGEDGVEGMAPAARALLSAAAVVYGGARHLALAAPLIRGEARRWPSPIAAALPDIAALRPTPIAVLASGDPYCFGIGTTLASTIPSAETICLPAPSAFSLACARLGWPVAEVACLSFCGRPVAALVPHLQPGARILALSADAATPHEVAALLRDRGFGPSWLHVLQALGGPRTRVLARRADEDLPRDIDPLNLLAIEVVAGPHARPLSLAGGLPDALFETDGQLTRQEIRAVTLAALAPLQGDLLWDIGTGSGSISIEWLLRHPSTRAIALDTRPDRAGRAARNATALGVPRLDVRVGEAPAALADWPAPDAVFIGGGIAGPGIIDAAWAALRPGGRIVANSVTVETEAVLLAAASRLGGTLRRIALERMEPLGHHHAFRPAMTVTQWAATKS